MPDFQRWERQESPRGSLTAPQTGPSLAESFASNGAAKPPPASDADGRAVEQPLVAEKIAQLQATLSKQLPELQAQSIDGGSAYPNLIDDLVKRETEAAIKEDNPDVQRYVRDYMNAFRTSVVTTGIKAQVATDLARHAERLGSVLGNLIQAVSVEPAHFKSALALLRDTVGNISVLESGHTDELLSEASRWLASGMFTAWARRDPPAAETALASPEYHSLLDAAQRQEFFEAIKRTRELNELQANLDLARAQTRFRSDVLARYNIQASRAEREGDFDLIPIADLERAFGKQAALEMQAELVFKARVATELVRLRNQSLAEDQALLASLDAAAEQFSDERRKRRRDLVAREIAAKRAAIEADPAGYACTINPDVRAAWDFITDGAMTAERVTPALVATEVALEALGLPPAFLRPVPRAVAEFLLELIRRQGTASDIAKLQAAFGAHYRHFIAAIASKAGPYLTTALMLDRTHQHAVQNILIAISRDPATLSELKRNIGLGLTQESMLEDSLAAELTDLLQSYVELPGGEAIAANFFRSAYALALHYIHRDQKSLREAAVLAAREIGTADYSFRQSNGHVYRIPAGYPADRIAMGAEEWLKQLAKQGRLKFVDDPYMHLEVDPGFDPDPGFVVTLPDDSGLKVSGDTFDFAGGKLITLSWSELQGLAAERIQRLIEQDQSERSRR